MLPSLEFLSVGNPTPAHRASTWLQFNVTLSTLSIQPQPDPIPGQRVLAAFAVVAEKLRRQGAASLWFWQSKEPGLRLRIQPRGRAAEEHRKADVALRAMLRELRRQGDVASWFASVYEPEIPALGGPATITAFYRHAMLDSRLHAAPSPAARDRLCAASVLTLTQLQDLFMQALPDNPEEVWDVWCHLAEMHGLPILPVGSVIAPPALNDLAMRCPHTNEGQDLRRCIVAVKRGNAELVRALDRAWYTGRLIGGKRRFLAIVALFHWNRIRLSSTQRHRLLKGMTARPAMLDRPLDLTKPNLLRT